MMELFLEPVDVWLFRDGKPFDAGSDHRARSLFPPHPSVMQGVIRSHHLVVKRIDLRNRQAIADAVGTADDFKDLRLRGPFIAREEGDKIVRYFPVPADVVPDKKAGAYRLLVPRRRQEMPYVLTSASDDLPMLLWPPEDCEPSKEGFGQWLAEAELLKCLQGEKAQAVGSDQLFVRESRFSIGMNDATRTTEEGALYEVEFVRPYPGVGLWVQVAGYDGWPATGTLRIGGEGRGAHLRQLEAALGWPQPPDPLPPRFKVYFAAPAYFEEGWQPKAGWGQFFNLNRMLRLLQKLRYWQPKAGWGQFFNGTVTLQAVALNRYESIGGFDWAANGQKPARRYVPAGSVYYFACEGRASLRADLVNQAITEYGAKIGFGQMIITEWKA